MSLVISNEEGVIDRLDEEDYENEEEMQEYIENNPEVVPLHEVKENTEFSVIAREYTIDGEYVDAIILDEDGDVYIIETKLENNSDKRQVIAQAFDYGAALWDSQQPYKTLEQLEGDLDHHSSLREWAEAELNLEGDSYDLFRNQLMENLDNGDFSYVIVMDGIEDRLKTLIKYLNQNSSFTLFGVELEYYEFDEKLIANPNIYGTELQKSSSQSTSVKKKKRKEALDLLQEKIEERLDFEPSFSGRYRYRQVRLPNPVPKDIHFEFIFKDRSDGEELQIRLDTEDDKEENYKAYSVLQTHLEELEKEIGEKTKEKGRKNYKVGFFKNISHNEILEEGEKLEWALDTMEAYIETLKDDLVKEFKE